jgi:hypothetical protein
MFQISNNFVKKTRKKTRPSVTPVPEPETQVTPVLDPKPETRTFVPKLYSSAKIRKFMKATETRRRSKYLQIICSDAGVCIAFGLEMKRLMDFFSFGTFEYTKHITRIGDPSSNGFVRLIEYEKEGYTSHAILKSSLARDADNLFLEYAVGVYLNEQTAFFPCIVSTYGLYRYSALESRRMARDHYARSHIYLNSNPGYPGVCTDNICLTPMIPPMQIGDICRDSERLCLLTQHLKDSITLYHKLKPFDETFYRRDALSTLYLIYFTLSKLSTNFTHYDLYSKNVLLYEPIPGSYIEYNIVSTGVRFKSRYFPKMIDYGRSYHPFGQNIIENVYASPDCPNRGTDNGFNFTSLRGDLRRANHFINSARKNESHDLRLLDSVDEYLADYMDANPAFQSDPLSELLEKVEFIDEYGTPENLTSGRPHKINNVTDAEHELRLLLQNPAILAQNEADYANLTRFGILNIYGAARAMEFEDTRPRRPTVHSTRST